jgi:cellobiose-specific phosphotransferase system component IIA
MRDMVLKEIALNKIVLYSKSDCMVSEASKIIIEGHEIQSKIVELDWLENGKEAE